MTKTVDGVDVVAFQSPESVRKLRDLRKRVEDLRAASDAARRKLSSAQANPAFFELQGKDVTTEIRARTVELQNAESALSGAKSDLAATFLAERGKFDVVRGELINRFRQITITPNVTHLRHFIEQTESAINDLVEKLNGLDLSDDTRELADFDAAITSWNTLVRELDGPGNASIDATNSASVSAAQILLSTAKDVVRVTAAIEKLRAAVNAAQARIAKPSGAK